SAPPDPPSIPYTTLFRSHSHIISVPHLTCIRACCIRVLRSGQHVLPVHFDMLETYDRCNAKPVDVEFVAEISGYGPEVIPVIGCRGSCACPSRIAGGQVAVAIGFLMQLHGRFEVMRLPSCLPVGLKSLLYTGDGKDPLAVGGAFTSV